MYQYRVRPRGLEYKIKVKNKAWFPRKDQVQPDEKGYIKIWHGEHRGRRLHVVLAEKKIGRPLQKDEVVHHKNGIKTDNRSENLVVLKKKEHDNLHNGKKICAHL